MIQPTYYIHSLLSFLFLFLLFGMLTSLNVFAACAKDSKTLFACNTTKGKRIEVCDAGKTIGYSFGKRGAKPEIALTLPREQVTTYQWDGVSTNFVNKVSIANGKTIYTVFHEIERSLGGDLDRKLKEEAGVEVEVNGRYITTIQCSKKNIVSDMDDVDLESTRKP
jgi:hypothetical protein